jgi:vesicle-fusing ATPase
MKNTEVKIERANGTTLRLTGADGSGSGIGLFRTKNLKAEALGVGGLDREFEDIVRRTLVTRVYPPSLMAEYGLQHVKGMLLYGPPGTGKTLMARTISKMLNGKEPVVKAGPELFNKYVGQTEENIRSMFKDAIAEYDQRGEDSELHVIVIDEIDALCKTRGSRGDGTGTGDSAVNQLLAMIDGVNALNNILVIGMTNRIDMIDPALLRPGRLELHVEVSLPDERGRLQILRIHTNTMAKNGRLAQDVSLEALARKTKNYTGADISGLVKSAASFALARPIDFANLKEPPKPDPVTQEHFERALAEVSSNRYFPTTLTSSFGVFHLHHGSSIASFPLLESDFCTSSPSVFLLSPILSNGARG